MLRAAVEIAVREARAHVGLPEAYEFDKWIPRLRMVVKVGGPPERPVLL